MSKHTQTYGYEDVGMQVRAHKPEDVRMQGYQQPYTNISLRERGCEDRGYKQAHMNLRIWGCKDAGEAHEPEDTRMQGWEDTSKYKWT